MILIVINRFSAKGKIYRPGETIRVSDGQPLIDGGYARKLTEDEAQSILSEYKRYAEGLFSEAPEETTDRRTSEKGNDKVACQGRLLE